MATIEENYQHWTAYDWKRAGDEWSEAWGGSRSLWLSTLWPRLQAFLPTARVLEIAPGFGRITEFLVPLSRRLVLVDLTERCIANCRERFRRHRHLDYHVNDGRSLAFLGPGSIDFALSFDSLVHAEVDAMESYLFELKRVLRPGGAAFLHHSNLADVVREPEREVENPHWRATSVGADGVATTAHRAGLDCVLQERLAWGGELLSDCFSVFVRRDSRNAPVRREHREFMLEAKLASERAALYETLPPRGDGDTLAGERPLLGRFLRRRTAPR